MKVGICNLCLETKQLGPESHIIPDSFYKFLYGKNKSIVYLNEQRKEIQHNSEYDEYILCQDCERNRLGKLDSYGANFLYKESISGTDRNIELIDGVKCLVIPKGQSYDYASLKLLLLSILWRASISSRPFFNKVKLPTEVQERIRLMILERNPGPYEEFPIFIFLPHLIHNPEGQEGFSQMSMVTMNPICAKNENGFELYKFLISGISYYFIISHPKTFKIVPSMTEKN